MTTSASQGVRSSTVCDLITVPVAAAFRSQGSVRFRSTICGSRVS